MDTIEPKKPESGQKFDLKNRNFDIKLTISYHITKIWTIFDLHFDKNATQIDTFCHILTKTKILTLNNRNFDKKSIFFYLKTKILTIIYQKLVK